MSRWTLAAVEKAAPDASSLAAARKLAIPGPWSDTGSTDHLVWGKCQGSGKTPYQVSIDLTGPAFRCSCPSRKFPCKHALALLMLWVRGDGSVSDVGEPADFAGTYDLRVTTTGSNTVLLNLPTTLPSRGVVTVLVIDNSAGTAPGSLIVLDDRA